MDDHTLQMWGETQNFGWKTLDPEEIYPQKGFEVKNSMKNTKILKIWEGENEGFLGFGEWKMKPLGSDAIFKEPTRAFERTSPRVRTPFFFFNLI